MRLNRIPAMLFLAEKANWSVLPAALRDEQDARRERCQPSFVSVLHQLQQLVIYPLA